MNIGSLNARCRVEYPVHSQDPVYGGDTITWTLLAVVWCNYQDELPSKSERVEQSLVLNTNRTRIRMRYRSDVDSAMRLVINRPNPTFYQIESGPAELGNKDGLEMMVVAFSSKGA